MGRVWKGRGWSSSGLLPRDANQVVYFIDDLLCERNLSVGPINLLDYEALARERLQPAVWDYYQGGTEDEVTVRANRAAFASLRLRPRVLVDVSNIDMRTTALGRPI